MVSPYSIIFPADSQNSTGDTPPSTHNYTTYYWCANCSLTLIQSASYIIISTQTYTSRISMVLQDTTDH